ncbi:hypothetical protein MRB53_013194 [Persea americana]|uniref:Uncharacterized protein n=1 Tax=Persea americana TaxID=3435 RepID=A0ACC2K7W7_PERAE|nr:hypothetical protein MRB53_013194 [Persea americana]
MCRNGKVGTSKSISTTNIQVGAVKRIEEAVDFFYFSAVDSEEGLLVVDEEDPDCSTASLVVSQKSQPAQKTWNFHCCHAGEEDHRREVAAVVTSVVWVAEEEVSRKDSFPVLIWGGLRTVGPTSP